MRLTKYGKREIILFSLLSLAGMAAVTAVALYAGKPWVLCFCAIPAAFGGFTLFFFRDPERTVPEDANLVIAPADGTVTEIAEVHENTYLKSKAKKVGIFLSLFSVHINRSPCSGTVEYLKYTPGKFLNAGDLRSSEVNESNAIGIATSRCKMLVRQISGVVARRIVCTLKEGDKVETGEKFGMIKFGSRTELYIPADNGFEVNVKLGQKIKAGETVLGIFRKTPAEEKDAQEARAGAERA